MKYISVTNNTKDDRSVGGQLVHAGCSIQVEASHEAEALKKGFKIGGDNSPMETQPPPPPSTGAEKLLDLLKKSVKVIEPELPELSDEEILQLDELEKKSETPRSTLIDAIALEIDYRGSAK